MWGTYTAKDSRGIWCCRKDRIQSCEAHTPLKTAEARGDVERIGLIVWGTATAKDSRGTWYCRKYRIQSCGAHTPLKTTVAFGVVETIGFNYVWGTYTAKDRRGTWECGDHRFVERIDCIVWGTYTAKDSRGTWYCRKDRIQSCGAHTPLKTAGALGVVESIGFNRVGHIHR